MSYYKILGLEKEPFSTSPDPEFFYQSHSHKKALANILIEIRLRRGLSVVLGDIGTGKTTLSRKLLQLLKNRKGIESYIILDPTYDTEYLFLLSLAKTFGVEIDHPEPNVLEVKEAIEHFVFHKSINENKEVVLLIDEAQKINQHSLEVLRILLNYETNNFKLLQLIVLGQMELLPCLKESRNLIDRVSLKCKLDPLREDETKEMISFRLRQAGYKSRDSLFADKAIARIYKYTQGYPRKISMFCHKALRLLVMKNKTVIDAKIVEEIVENEAKFGLEKENLFHTL
ncbi:MAG: AAA family ATPase [Candidatus Omnitrophica bacterium]|nr:AAA family ATPase [Candidatus Omnitrophota bacterium]MCF7878328.1 AAA family ATPase [Candidatus Omnitrophota bacterium]